MYLSTYYVLPGVVTKQVLIFGCMAL